MAAGTAFSSQSMSFTPSGTVFNTNDTFTLDSFVSFSGYSAVGMSYWLEVPGAAQSFFHITAETWLTFTDPTQPGEPNNFDFPMTNGVDAGMFATSNDLGATPQPLVLVPPATYQVVQSRGPHSRSRSCPSRARSPCWRWPELGWACSPTAAGTRLVRANPAQSWPQQSRSTLNG